MTACHRTVAECLDAAQHGGRLQGANRIGEACADGRLVRIGLFLDAGGRVERAHWKASCCATLMAYAELACLAVEAGIDPLTIDARWLDAHLHGVHPGRRDRAALVIAALRAALNPEVRR